MGERSPLPGIQAFFDRWLARLPLPVTPADQAAGRYVVCVNPEAAAQDRQDREKILAALQPKLAQGGIKRLIPHRGTRRFLRVRAGRFEIDPRRGREDAREDGQDVLRTTTDLPAEAVALAYKNLLWIERLFRELKPLLQTRPISHHWGKDNVTGHIFGCFLALYLVVVLRKKIEALGLRTDLTGVAHVAFQAVSLRPPPLALLLYRPAEPATV